MTARPAAIEEDAPVSDEEADALFTGLRADTSLVVAVSGGPDSVALLVLLAEWARAPGRPRLHAATVEHGLRVESAAEARSVARLCDDLGLSHAILPWRGEKPVTGRQAAARTARYRLLADEARRLGGAVVVTAHTRDDQAETLLMRMAHGSGPVGLAGMRPRTRRDGITLARPLLDTPKARLLATLRDRGLGFADDPSNRDQRYERVRWRAVLPALASCGLSAERLALLARRLARMDEALADRAAGLWPEVMLGEAEDGTLAIRFAALLAEPEEMTLRLLSHALATVAGDGLGRLERLESCVAALRDAARNGQALTRTLSGCVLRLRRDGVLLVGREPVRRRGVHPAAS